MNEWENNLENAAKNASHITNVAFFATLRSGVFIVEIWLKRDEREHNFNSISAMPECVS